MKAFVRALLVTTFTATFLHAADTDRAKQMAAARAEFFKADKVVRVEIEVDQSGMEALRKTPHPWFDRKVGKGSGPMNLVEKPYSPVRPQPRLGALELFLRQYERR